MDLVEQRIAQLREIADRRDALLRQMFRMIKCRRSAGLGSLLGVGEGEEEEEEEEESGKRTAAGTVGEGDGDTDEEELKSFLARFDLFKNPETGRIGYLDPGEYAYLSPSEGDQGTDALEQEHPRGEQDVDVRESSIPALSPLPSEDGDDVAERDEGERREEPEEDEAVEPEAKPATPIELVTPAHVDEPEDLEPDTQLNKPVPSPSQQTSHAPTPRAQSPLEHSSPPDATAAEPTPGETPPRRTPTPETVPVDSDDELDLIGRRPAVVPMVPQDEEKASTPVDDGDLAEAERIALVGDTTSDEEEEEEEEEETMNVQVEEDGDGVPVAADDGDVEAEAAAPEPEVVTEAAQAEDEVQEAPPPAMDMDLSDAESMVIDDDDEEVEEEVPGPPTVPILPLAPPSPVMTPVLIQAPPPSKAGDEYVFGIKEEEAKEEEEEKAAIGLTTKINNYTLPPVRYLPADSVRMGKGRGKQQRKKDKDKKDSTWVPMGVSRWGATLRANPVHVRVARAAKCLGTKEWSIAMTELRLVRALDQIDTLKEAGRWSFRQPKKQRGVGGLGKTHWDYVMDEARWMRIDFREERRWKLAMAYHLSTAVLEWHACRDAEERVKAGVCVGWRRPVEPDEGDDAGMPSVEPQLLGGVDYGSDEDEDEDADAKGAESTVKTEQVDEQLALKAPANTKKIFAPLREYVTYSDKMVLNSEDLKRVLPGVETLPSDIGEAFPDVPVFSLPAVSTPPVPNNNKKSEKRGDRDDPNKRVEETTYTKLFPIGTFMHVKPTLLGPLQPAKRWAHGTWIPAEDSVAANEGLGSDGKECFSDLFRGAPPPHTALPPPSNNPPRRIWTQGDDSLLRSLAERYPGNWMLIAECFNSARVTIRSDRRSGRECADRWRELSDAVKTAATPTPESAAGSDPAGTMTTRGVKRLASVSVSGPEGSASSNKRRRHQYLQESIRKLAKKRIEQNQKTLANQRKQPGMHETHAQFNRLPKRSPAELSRIKADRDQKDQQELMARRKQDEIVRARMAGQQQQQQSPQQTQSQPAPPQQQQQQQQASAQQQPVQQQQQTQQQQQQQQQTQQQPTAAQVLQQQQVQQLQQLQQQQQRINAAAAAAAVNRGNGNASTANNPPAATNQPRLNPNNQTRITLQQQQQILAQQRMAAAAHQQQQLMRTTTASPRPPGQQQPNQTQQQATAPPQAAAATSTAAGRGPYMNMNVVQGLQYSPEQLQQMIAQMQQNQHR